MFMKLSDYKGEDAIILWGDLLEPTAEILGDKAIAEAYNKHEKIVSIISLAIKKHAGAVLQILARIDNVPVEEYQISALALPAKLLDIVNEMSNNDDLKQFFPSQGQQTGARPSGSATENTEE